MVQLDIEDAIYRPNEAISIQVGERRFETTKKTLQPTAWEKIEPKLGFKTLSDGTKLYLLDMDGDVFGHILRWLRHGIIPAFVDANGDPDRAMYSVLHDQAIMLEAIALRDWLSRPGFAYWLPEGLSYVPVFRDHLIPSLTDDEYFSDEDLSDIPEEEGLEEENQHEDVPENHGSHKDHVSHKYHVSHMDHNPDKGHHLHGERHHRDHHPSHVQHHNSKDHHDEGRQVEGAVSPEAASSGTNK
ncbi:hypothetical protein MMC10_008671 [Thelotrema lepadinum]|nr:hypothetical protein [Thelotrema lepadinum]